MEDGGWVGEHVELGGRDAGVFEVFGFDHRFAVECRDPSESVGGVRGAEGGPGCFCGGRVGAL